MNQALKLYIVNSKKLPDAGSMAPATTPHVCTVWQVPCLVPTQGESEGHLEIDRLLVGYSNNNHLLAISHGFHN